MRSGIYVVFVSYSVPFFVTAPGPDVKRSTDYVSPLFRMDLVPRSRTSVAEKFIDCISNGTDNNNDAIW